MRSKPRSHVGMAAGCPGQERLFPSTKRKRRNGCWQVSRLTLGKKLPKVQKSQLVVSSLSKFTILKPKELYLAPTLQSHISSGKEPGPC